MAPWMGEQVSSGKELRRKKRFPVPRRDLEDEAVALTINYSLQLLNDGRMKLVELIRRHDLLYKFP